VKRLIWTEPSSHVNTLLDRENHHFYKCIPATLFTNVLAIFYLLQILALHWIILRYSWQIHAMP
jgi:hypothetical protein